MSLALAYHREHPRLLRTGCVAAECATIQAIAAANSLTCAATYREGALPYFVKDVAKINKTSALHIAGDTDLKGRVEAPKPHGGNNLPPLEN